MDRRDELEPTATNRPIDSVEVSTFALKRFGWIMIAVLKSLAALVILYALER
jgi:hypothetical protein